LLLWSVGAPALLQKAHAANLTSISDTLSTSNLSTNAKHTIRFTTVSSIPNNGTGVIKISFDGNAYGGASAFAEAFSSATSTDILVGTSTSNGYTVVSTCTAGNQMQAVGNYNNGTDENLTLTLCNGAPTPIGATTTVQIAIGAGTQLITNPASTNSYRINVNVTNATNDSGETRVAVLPNVTLTASVSTSFTFTVAGLATSTGLGLAGGYSTTTASSTATALPFGQLDPNSATGTILGQQLYVSSNARNGFSVTVQENQPPTSSTGATIDLFANGATSSTPIAWTVPTDLLDQPQTYGHFGITSDDTSDGSTTPNEFGGGNLWAGNIDQPRVVFSHTGPSDGLTQNEGTAKVGYRIQIRALQEAGADYTNTITYVATPTF